MIYENSRSLHRYYPYVDAEIMFEEFVKKLTMEKSTDALLFEALQLHPKSIRINPSGFYNIPKTIDQIRERLISIQDPDQDEIYLPYWFRPNRLIVLPNIEFGTNILIPERAQPFEFSEKPTGQQKLALLAGTRLATLHLKNPHSYELVALLNDMQLEILAQMIGNFGKGVKVPFWKHKTVIDSIRLIAHQNRYDMWVKHLGNGSYQLIKLV